MQSNNKKVNHYYYKEMYNAGKIFKKELIIHPLNIIILFIINTSVVRLHAGLPIKFQEAGFSFLIIIVFTLCVFFIIKRRIKNNIKVSLLLSYILFVSLFFTDIFELLVYAGLRVRFYLFSIFIGELFVVILLLIILLVVLTLLIKKTRFKLLRMNSYLNVLTLVYLASEVIGCSFSPDINKVELKEIIRLKPSLNDSIRKPDIYFIILDGYTGFSGLKKLWNFDNADLKKFLLNNGFFVANNGKSVYNLTNYSLTSTFNMTKLNFDYSDLYSKSNYLLLADYMKFNPVVKHLNQSGYNFINLSFFDIFDKKRYYEDIYFLKKGNIYQARTIWGHFYEMLYERIFDMSEINTDIFKELVKIRGSYNEKPKFVFAHIMMPHPPYYFDADGNRTDLIYSSDSKDKDKYLKQLMYTNKLLTKTISNILRNSESSPIIVVQGDHGFRSYDGIDKIEIEHSALSCFYFPDKDYSLLTDSVKTVNTFRIIFNKYFNQRLELIN